MKAILKNPFVRRYAIPIYIGWCLLKGLFFLLAGWLFS